MKPVRTVKTIDSHTAGEGTRLVVGGLPDILGDTMEEKLTYAQKHLAWLPGWLLREPRGHRDLFGAVMTSPCHPEAVAGVLYMDNTQFEPACGHATMGLAASMLASGMVPTVEPETTLAVDTPAGLVRVRANVRDGQVVGITQDCVPAFVVRREVPVTLDELGRVLVDVVFSGNFFALVDLDLNRLDLALEPSRAGWLAGLGMRTLQAVNEAVSVRHPELASLDGIIDVRFFRSLPSPNGDPVGSRSVVVLGDHMVDRSPCGTGTCAEMALRFARGELEVGREFVAEGILGTSFRGRILGETTVGQGQGAMPAVRPQITGNAYVTGFNQWVLDAADPFPEGFLLAP